MPIAMITAIRPRLSLRIVRDHGVGQAGTPFADTGAPMTTSASAMSSPSAGAAAAIAASQFSERDERDAGLLTDEAG
jgi:hypothetical protein